MSQHFELIARELNLPSSQVEACVKLFDEKNTIPFIARYRKEVTGGLDEEQLRNIYRAINKQRALDDRRKTILREIEEQGKLSDELRVQIQSATTQVLLEDLYQPYKPKRQTRASIARQNGLQELAELIIKQVLTSQTLDQLANSYLNEVIPTEADVWNGAMDIVAEQISDHTHVRQLVRDKAFKWGVLKCERVDQLEDRLRVYEQYYDFQHRINRLRPHQILAINRGESEKILRVKVVIQERDWRQAIAYYFKIDPQSPLAGFMRKAVEDAAQRLLIPSIERDIRRLLTETAGNHAIRVFADNLQALLYQPPISGRIVLGIDPGFRTGCKVAIVDQTGRLLDTATIYPHAPHNKWEDSLRLLSDLIFEMGITLIAIGNGTASRETEGLIAELIQKIRTDPTIHKSNELQYIIVNEAGASIYSASLLARSELPALDVSIRGAVSIARRVQDPLAELVKIEPRSIGVGLYQHDVNQKLLAETLHGVVEDVVNTVGVEVNTTSQSLLTYVAGIGSKLAETLVKYREEHGAFKDRMDFQKVSGLGPKSFEQSAGFLRIMDADNPLDSTAIHPESYSIAQALLDELDLSISMPMSEKNRKIDSYFHDNSIHDLAIKLGCGEPTLKDIIDQFLRPGRDPRVELPKSILRDDILRLEDLILGIQLSGTVRNVVDFGAFVDIGVKQDGLLHRSQIPTGIEIKVGDVIQVEIINVEKERGRIQLGWVR